MSAQARELFDDGMRTSRGRSNHRKGSDQDQACGMKLSSSQPGSWRQAAIWLGMFLFLFAAIQSLLPLGTAIQIGADEGFELAKVTLCAHGYKLYTQIWNDQPPLHTFLITQIVKHV